jgi:hypothetical protein
MGLSHKTGSFAPGRLWSLREMHEFKLKPIIDILDVLVNCSGMMHSHHPKIYPVMGKRTRSDVSKLVTIALPHLAAAELDLCHKSAERLLGALEDSDQTVQVLPRIDDLRGRLLDQLETTYCLLLSASERRLYESSEPPFGKAHSSFPSASEDMYEATKCLALGRSTACVMHLMRVVEAGLKCLAGTLQVPEQADWGGYLRKIEEELDARIKKAGKRTPDEQFFAEAKAMINNVRLAWRNPTMHIATTYTPERANEILQAVRALMSHLASKLREWAT